MCKLHFQAACRCLTRFPYVGYQNPTLFSKHACSKVTPPASASTVLMYFPALWLIWCSSGTDHILLVSGKQSLEQFSPCIFFLLQCCHDKEKKRKKLLLFSKCHFQVYSNSKAEAFTQTFLKRSLEHQSKFDLKDLSRRALILDYPRHKRDASASKHKKAKGLNAQQKRKNNIYQIKPEHQRLVMISGINVSLLKTKIEL